MPQIFQGKQTFTWHHILFCGYSDSYRDFRWSPKLFTMTILSSFHAHFTRGRLVSDNLSPHTLAYRCIGNKEHLAPFSPNIIPYSKTHPSTHPTYTSFWLQWMQKLCIWSPLSHSHFKGKWWGMACLLSEMTSSWLGPGRLCLVTLLGYKWWKSWGWQESK